MVPRNGEGRRYACTMALPRKFLNDDEELLAEMHPHWIFLFGPLFTSIGVWAAIIVLLILWRNPPGWTNYPIIILALIPGLWLLGRFIRWKSYDVALTSTRILVRQGIMGRDTVQLRLQRITEVNLRQSLIERMLGTGSLVIDVQGEDDSLTLEYMRKPAVVQRVINSQINEIVGGGQREIDPRGAATPGPPPESGTALVAQRRRPERARHATVRRRCARRHRRQRRPRHQLPSPSRYATASSSSTTCGSGASSPRRSSPPRRASCSTASKSAQPLPAQGPRNPGAVAAPPWEDSTPTPEQGDGRMHAHVVNVNITDSDAAVKGLEELVPTVKAAPGFVAGYWIRLDERPRHLGRRLRDRGAGPRRGAPVGGGMAGVTVTGVQLGEVVGSA